MKICRFKHDSSTAIAYGVIEGDMVRPAPSNLPWREAFGQLSWNYDAKEIRLGEVQLIAPVSPSKIVCVGRNYREHAAELGNPMPTEPLLFLKAPSSIISHEEAIELPPESKQVEHEGELGVVIGRRARKLRSDDDPLHYVLGYTCLNDVTARDLQRKDVQFTRGKSFDTFCPVGPFIETELNPADVEVVTRVNGLTKQRGRTSQMAFSVAMLIRYISHIMTLYPGDLIATGTPAGVSRLEDGHTVEVEVEGIGTLRNRVKSLESVAKN
jgi:2-keto-4-pentenoate hydratase/2-oxohepta-3-ene-1,7-dioic acid hydratase in catechol pathway